MITWDKIDSELKAIVRDVPSEPDFAQTLENKYLGIRETLSPVRLDYCFSRFLDAEFDITTAGNRGLGRTTESVPRLGAYYRSEFERFSEEVLEKLRGLAEQTLLRGYFVHVLNIDQGDASSENPTKEDLYEKWIPRIYVTGMEEFPEEFREIFLVFCEDPIADFLNILEQKQVKKSSGLFRKDLSFPILMYYGIAGFGIRAVEVGR